MAGKDRSVSALVEQVAEGDLEPTGVVTVELRDERGKVVDKEVKPNFIAKTWKAYARSRMRMQWMGFGYNKQFTGQASTATDPLFPYGPATTPIFPADMLACWNQTGAEDAANEHTPIIPATGLVAWATRWPFGAATGGRGNVNVTDSFVDDDTVRHVFDWTSSQGNGTFQSVGWLRAGSNTGLHLLSAGTQQRTNTAVTWSPSIISGGTSLAPSFPFIDPATGTTYVLMRRQAGSVVHRVVSYAGTALAASGLSIVGTKAIDTQAVSNVTGEFTPTSAVNNVSTFITQCAVLGRLTGASVISYDTAATSAGTHRWGVVNDAGTTATTYANPTTGWYTGAVIGTTVYLSGNNGASTGDIYTYNTGTGVLGSTIAMSASVTALCTAAGITTPRAHRITTDGTYLYVLYANGSGVTTAGGMLLVKLDTGGVLQQIIGAVPHNQTTALQTDTASVPYAGAAYFSKAWWSATLDYGGLTVDANAAVSLSEDLFSALPTTQGDVVSVNYKLPAMNDIQAAWYTLTMSYYDGSVFFGCWQNSVSTAATNNLLWMRQGFDLGSRVLLSSAKTKTVGQTMRITYDITIPGWF